MDATPDARLEATPGQRLRGLDATHSPEHYREAVLRQGVEGPHQIVVHPLLPQGALGTGAGHHPCVPAVEAVLYLVKALGHGTTPCVPIGAHEQRPLNREQPGKCRGRETKGRGRAGTCGEQSPCAIRRRWRLAVSSREARLMCDDGAHQ
jgi:hypothetical protein